jgi:single-strand DNA-binding protein
VEATAGDLDELADPFDDRPEGPAAEEDDDELAAEPAAGEPDPSDGVEGVTGTGRARRGRRQTPVPA